MSQLNLYRLPNEMWIAVFEAITSPADLFKVIQTCKHFYQLAIRVLYRNIQWTSPLAFARNAPFWLDRTDAMPDVPTSLVVSISHMPINSFARFDPQTAIVDLDGTWRLSPPYVKPQGPIEITEMTHSARNTDSSENIGNTGRRGRDERRMAFFASKSLYDAMARQIIAFSNLRELTFHRAELPPIIYTVIQSLPHLRHLTIQYCTFPSVGGGLHPSTTPGLPVQLDTDMSLFEGDDNDDDMSDSDDDTSNLAAPTNYYPDFTTLPLTSLKLWGNKGDTDSGHGLSNTVYALHLCTAASLQTLKIDWSPTSARFLAQLNPNTSITLPPNLHHLTLRMPTSKVWPSEDTNNTNPNPNININITIGGTPTFTNNPGPGTHSTLNLLNPLQIFLISIPSLRSLTVVNRLPSLDLPAGVLPNLKAYTGPMGTVLAMLKGAGSGGCLRHLEITDVDKKVADFVGAFLPAVAGQTEGGYAATSSSSGRNEDEGTWKGKGKEKEKEKEDGERRGLWSLSVVLREWDNEILFAVTQHFEELRKVKIRYEDGFPSEYTLISLGAQFLHRLPSLKKLHLYQIPRLPKPLHARQQSHLAPPPWGPVHHTPGHGPGHQIQIVAPHDNPTNNTSSSDSDDDILNHAPSGLEHPIHTSTLRPLRPLHTPSHTNAPPPPSIPITLTQGPQSSPDDVEVRGLIVPWRRYACELREVRFVEEAVWRRAWDGDVWCKRGLGVRSWGGEGRKTREMGGGVGMRRERVGLGVGVEEYEGESEGEGVGEME